MKLIINSMQVDEQKLRAVFQLEQDVLEKSRAGYEIERDLKYEIVNRLADKFIGDHGGEILASISKDQVISSILLRVGTLMSGGR